MTFEQPVYVVVRVTETLTVVTRGKFLMTDGVRVVYRPVNSYGDEAGMVRGADVGDVYEDEGTAKRNVNATSTNDVRRVP